MSLPPSSLSSLTLSVSSTALTSPLTYDVPLSSVTMGSNSIQIPPTSSVVNAFNTKPAGTTFSYSLNASYADGLRVVTTPGLNNFIPKLISVTPVIYLANMIKSITSSQFTLQPTIENRGIGALSFTSSDTKVATVNSSTGFVTITGKGTTTITVSLARVEDGAYLYAPASTTATLVVTSSPPVWKQLGGDIDGEGGNNDAGRSVSISQDGSIVAMGAPNNAQTSILSGKVRVYKYNGTTLLWSQLGGDLDGETPGDHSGCSVSLSADGTRVAIGARFNDGNGTSSGHVRVYQYNADKTTANSLGPVGWDQLGGDIDGEASGDASGRSISLSHNGNRLAIGATGNGGNGSASGHARVYEYNGTTWTKLGQDLDGEATNDGSGFSVSLSSDGSRVAIGAYWNSGNGSASGHVRVYEYNGTTWTKLGQDLDGEATNDFSGFSVSLSGDGNRLAIGASFNDGNGPDSGHVRVYQYNGTTKLWTQLGQDIDGEAANDLSGCSVSLSGDGNRLAIGAYSNGVFDSGHVRVYQYNGTTWTKLGEDIDGEAGGDLSGTSVSLSGDGNRLAIGAPLNDGNGTDSGQVRIYQYNGTTWTKLGQDLDGEATNDYSGRNVSLSSDGNIVAIGAQYNDGNGKDSGHARVYKYNPNKKVAQLKPSLPGFGPVGWDQLGQDLDGAAPGDQCVRVSLSGDGTIVAIGATNNDNNGSNSGHVRVYQYNGTTKLWTKLGQDLDGEAAGDLSGRSVSLSSDGTRVAIGAVNNDGNGSNSGHTRVYEYNGTTWTKLGQDLDGEATNDNSGVSVSLSSDGSRVAIGAPNNDNSNGTDSGHTRVYEYNGTILQWTQIGQDLDGEAANDLILSVSLSGDGTRVAIGAIYNDGGGTNSGHTRVYEYNETTKLWLKLGQDLDGEAASDESGVSVSLSSDGSILAIGAPFNDGTTVNSNRGHVRVYQYNGTTKLWTRLGEDIDGEAANDQSGFYVSLSSDGTRVAIGAVTNDDNGTDSGQVRVYQLS